VSNAIKSKNHATAEPISSAIESKNQRLGFQYVKWRSALDRFPVPEPLAPHRPSGREPPAQGCRPAAI